MMKVGSVCSRAVDLVDSAECVYKAAQRMLQRNVGTLIIQNLNRLPTGIVTDRDLTLRVLARGLDPRVTVVSEVMTPNPKTVCEEMPIEAALGIMKSEPCRRLPVVDRAGVLVGVISLDDIHELHAQEANMMRRILQREGPGRAEPESSQVAVQSLGPEES